MPHMLFTLNKHYRIEGQKKGRERRKKERREETGKRKAGKLW